MNTGNMQGKQGVSRTVSRFSLISFNIISEGCGHSALLALYHATVKMQSNQMTIKTTDVLMSQFY